MNRVVQSLMNVLWQLDEKQQRRVLAIIVGGLVLFFGGLMYLQVRSLGKLRREMIAINADRVKIRDLLSRNEFLKQEQQRGQAIIDQDKHFKLSEYIETLVAHLGIKNNLKSYPVTINDLEQLQSLGYQEVKMDAEFVDLNMQQLVRLLQELEQNNRIDIKMVDLVRSKKDNALDVTIALSTLQHKAETAATFETE